MQCGVACLAMICRHYGLNIGLESLQEMCPPSREGVSMLAISETAKSLGLENATAKISVETLFEAPLPAILHWNQNHFVVLCRIRDGRRFYIADPGKGLTTCSREEFCHHWLGERESGDAKGIAMFFMPGQISEQPQHKNDKNKRTFRFILGYLKHYRAYFTQIVLGMLLGCVLQLVMPFLTQMIVDVGIRHEDIGLIWLILLGELMIIAGQTLTDFIRRWLLMHISMRINISLVSDFFIKLLKLPMSFFDTKLMGDLMQRMGDHSRVQSFLTGQVLGIAFSALSFVVFGIVLLIYDPLIFAVFIAGSALYALWMMRFLQRRKILDYELFEQQSKNQGKTFRFISNMQEIKLQDCEQRRRWEWEDVQADLFAVQLKSMKLQQTQEAGSIFINELKNILVTVIAATAVINGQITLGMMLAIQYIIGQLNSPVEQLLGLIYSVQDVKISLERINEIHCEPNEEDGSGKLTSFPNCDLSIALKNIDFKYDPHSLRKTIDSVSFTIPQGKVTAIVGASGSGKTTLVKLILGYYRVMSGAIEIGGVNIDRYNLKWWRNHCGVVMQDGVIFSESIARNIAVNDSEIDYERLERAARIACVHDFVMAMPLKYDTEIGPDGMGLSQGQKQRILIARAVYKDPQFILLDEATNSLDARNEREIVENLADFYRGRTVVVVAHRLSTVKNADMIVVVDNGKVVETGTHDSLTSKRGYYYDLVKNQLELGL